MNPKLNYTRLPVEGAYNVRELGGYDAGGRITRHRAFLRADDLVSLTEADIQYLIGYGVKTVVDLRSEDEVASRPDPFAKQDGVKYLHLPLGMDDVDDVTRILAENPELFIEKFYLDIVRRASAMLKGVLKAIADAPAGCVLFHCTAGKDRTGITAAMLLGIAGVSRADIVSNYEVTFTYIKQSPMVQKVIQHYPAKLMQSRAEYIEAVLDYIEEQHGTVEEYVRAIGLSEARVAKLKRRLLGRGA